MRDKSEVAIEMSCSASLRLRLAVLWCIALVFFLVLALAYLCCCSALLSPYTIIYTILLHYFCDFYFSNRGRLIGHLRVPK